MREINACGTICREQRKRSQQAVDAHPHREPVPHRFDVDIACAHVHGFLDEVVDGAYHRRAAREIAEAVNALIGDRDARGQALSGSADRRLQDAHRAPSQDLRRKRWRF